MPKSDVLAGLDIGSAQVACVIGRRDIGTHLDALTALGARVRLSGGKVTVIDGPFTEAKEIIGGYAQFELKSKEEAVDSAVRFMELHKKYWPGWEGETEVRQMFNPEDFTHCKP